MIDYHLFTPLEALCLYTIIGTALWISLYLLVLS